MLLGRYPWEQRTAQTIPRKYENMFHSLTIPVSQFGRKLAKNIVLIRGNKPKFCERCREKCWYLKWFWTNVGMLSFQHDLTYLIAYF